MRDTRIEKLETIVFLKPKRPYIKKDKIIKNILSENGITIQYDYSESDATNEMIENFEFPLEHHQVNDGKQNETDLRLMDVSKSQKRTNESEENENKKQKLNNKTKTKVANGLKIIKNKFFKK